MFQSIYVLPVYVGRVYVYWEYTLVCILPVYIVLYTPSIHILGVYIPAYTGSILTSKLNYIESLKVYDSILI